MLFVATTDPLFIGGTNVAELEIEDIDVADAEENAVDPESCEVREL